MSPPTVGPDPSDTTHRLPRRRLPLRITALILAVTPLSLLALAGQLEPNSAGLGTHQQLGLPPCSMRVIFGVRCPSCGMTTSWAHFMNGEWFASFQVNPGGFLLAPFSITFALLALRTCWTGNYPSRNSQRLVAVSLLAIAAVTLVDWTGRLVGF